MPTRTHTSISTRATGAVFTTQRPAASCKKDRCTACFMRDDHCICPHTPRVSTNLDVLVFRHSKEKHKVSNTVRLLSLSLPRCTIVEYGGRDGLDLRHLLEAKNPVLLFPSDNPQPNPNPNPLPLPYVPQTLVVVDGSWGQARKLVNKLPQLPRLHVHPGNTVTVRFRRPPMPDHMSTIEAVARALDKLEGGRSGDELDVFYQRAVQACGKSRARSFVFCDRMAPNAPHPDCLTTLNPDNPDDPQP